MRFMIIVKATTGSEVGTPPPPDMLAAMGTFNDELTKAGVMLDAAGLKASKYGARVTVSLDNKRSVVDGPFTETKELVAGFWIWECKSLDEAIEWVKRCPHPHPHEAAEIEIRPFIDLAEVPGLLDEARAIAERGAASKK